MSSLIKRDREIEEINKLCAEIETIGRTAIEHALRVGEILTLKKSQLKHGDWGDWFSKNIKCISQQTASRFMRLHAMRDTPKLINVINLTEAYALMIEDKKSKPRGKQARVTEIKSERETDAPAEEHISKLVNVTNLKVERSDKESAIEHAFAFNDFERYMLVHCAKSSQLTLFLSSARRYFESL